MEEVGKVFRIKLNNMKNRIRNNWTITRLIYLVIGILVVIQSSIDHQWFAVAFGCYFAAMGLFAFGCAAGNCYNGSCETSKSKVSN